MVIVVVRTPNHVILFSNFTFEFVDQIVKMVNLLTHVSVILPQSQDFFCFLIFKVLNLSILVLKNSKNLIVLSHYALFPFVHHFQLLIISFSKLLNFLNFLVTGSILNISDFFFEDQFVTNENVVKFFIFKSEFL